MPKKVYYKIKLQRSNATKSPSRNLCPSPMATTINHLLSSIVTRPHTSSSSGACVYFFNLYNFLLSKDSSVHCFAQFRIATFWTITVCCYLQICVHVHAARFGDVWNSFPGFAWVLLRCIWDIVRQNRNQMNIDAQQNAQQEHVPFEVPWPKANASHNKM